MSVLSGTIYDYSLIATATNNNVFGDAGNDILIGSDNDDFLDGWSGNDSLTGNSGDDILLGYTGNDSLIGGVGGDLLIGEAGDDLLNGYGQTNFEYDYLSGGVGADIFILGDSFEAFYQEAGFATITDFNFSEGDKIQVFGNIDDYSLSEFYGGIDIYYQDDLIGYVENTANVILEEDFLFV